MWCCSTLRTTNHDKASEPRARSRTWAGAEDVGVSLAQLSTLGAVEDG